jgi:hypothetical protein
LFTIDERLGDIALRSFWSELDAEKKGSLWDGIEQELENFAARHGMPTAAYQARQVFEAERAEQRGDNDG